MPMFPINQPGLFGSEFFTHALIRRRKCRLSLHFRRRWLQAIITHHVHVVKSGPRLSQVEQGIFGVPNSAPTARAGLCHVARGIIRWVERISWANSLYTVNL